MTEIKSHLKHSTPVNQEAESDFVKIYEQYSDEGEII